MWMIQQFVFDPHHIRNVKRGRIDAFGFVALTIWLGALQTVLNRGQDEDWFNSSFICWFSVICVVAFVAFIVREFTARDPLTDLRVFADRNFTSCTVLVSVTFFLLYGIMNLQPIMAQGLMGYTAYQSGLTQVSRGLGVLVLTPLVGVLTGKVDNRLLIGPGMVLIAAASFLMGDYNLDISSYAFFWPNFIQGMGMALTMIPLMTVAMATIRHEEMGNATGLFALARNLAGSIGIAVVIAMVTRGAQAHQAHMVAHLTPYDLSYQSAAQMGQAVLAPSMGGAQAQPGTLGVIYKSLLLQSNMLAFVDEFRWLALLCFVSTVLAFLIKRTQGKNDIVMH
jgi:DHA2 family multidrug resistance protein